MYRQTAQKLLPELSKGIFDSNWQREWLSNSKAALLPLVLTLHLKTQPFRCGTESSFLYSKVVNRRQAVFSEQPVRQVKGRENLGSGARSRRFVLPRLAPVCKTSASVGCYGHWLMFRTFCVKSGVLSMCYYQGDWANVYEEVDLLISITPSKPNFWFHFSFVQIVLEV